MLAKQLLSYALTHSEEPEMGENNLCKHPESDRSKIALPKKELAVLG